MAETTTEAPPELPYTPIGFGDLAKQLMPGTESALAEARQKRERIGEEEQAAIKRRGEAMAPAIGAARESLSRPLPEPPKAPVLPPPPSRGLHDFLAPVENEPPERSVMKLISALGVMGAGIGGLAKGDARGALAALTGALTGWREGDRERADRAFADWQANMDRLLKNADLEQRQYRDIMENANLTNSQRLQEIKLAALGNDHELMATAAAKDNADAVISQLTQDRNHYDQVNAAAQRLQLAHEDKIRQQDLMQQYHEQQRLDRERRDREAMEFKREQEARHARAFEVMSDIAREQAITRRMAVEMHQGQKKEKEAKHDAQVEVMQTALNQMRALMPEMERKKFFQQSVGLFPAGTAWAHRLFNTGDPTLSQWAQHTQTLVGFDRTIMNDLARAKNAYAAGQEFIKNPPTLEASKAVIDQMQTLLDAETRGRAGEGTAAPPTQRTIKWEDIK